MSVFSTAKTAIKFLANSYTYPSGRVVSFEDIELKTALISLSQAKKIVKTEVMGQDGTVKEYVGQDDYYVTVSGALTAPVNSTPFLEMIQLKKMLDCPVVIDVVCEWLQDLGVHQLVLENYDLPQMAGGASYQNFSLQFVSDKPIELVIQDV